MRVVVIDSEKNTLEFMKDVISRNNIVKVVKGFSDPIEALDLMEYILPDVIFMDTDKSNITIDLATKIINLNIPIVFITSQKETYSENRDVNYLLKPITEESLNGIIDKLQVDESLNKRLEIRVNILGDFKVCNASNDQCITWTTAKVQELFALFVFKKGAEIDKWTICNTLWPNSEPKKVEQNLYSTIHRLKVALKNIGVDNIIQCKKGVYRIDLKNFSCDAWEFESFVEKNNNIDEENLHSHEDIIYLFKGRPFGANDYIWAAEYNQKFERYYLRILRRIAQYYINKSYNNKAEEYLNKILELDPCDEKANELFMKLYFNRGEKIKLIKYYDNFCRLLNDELGIEPKESTEKYYKNLLNNL